MYGKQTVVTCKFCEKIQYYTTNCNWIDTTGWTG